MENLGKMEETGREIGHVIGAAIDAKHGKGKVGFALLLFDFNAKGHLTYISNAQRDDMVKALQECVESLLSGAVNPPRRPRRGRRAPWMPS